MNTSDLFDLPDPDDPAGRPARLAVGVVGTGRVGTALGAALQLAGHQVVAASGVSALSRRRAEALLPGVRLVTPLRCWPPPTWSC